MRVNQEQTASLQPVLCLVLPLTMLWFPDVQSAIQRLMDLPSFTWLWLQDPRGSHGT